MLINIIKLIDMSIQRWYVDIEILYVDIKYNDGMLI